LVGPPRRVGCPTGGRDPLRHKGSRPPGSHRAAAPGLPATGDRQRDARPAAERRYLNAAADHATLQPTAPSGPTLQSVGKGAGQRLLLGASAAVAPLRRSSAAGPGRARHVGRRALSIGVHVATRTATRRAQYPPHAEHQFRVHLVEKWPVVIHPVARRRDRRRGRRRPRCQSLDHPERRSPRGRYQPVVPRGDRERCFRCILPRRTTSM